MLLALLRSQYIPVTNDRRPPPRGYDMDAALMSFEQHERGIHAL
jgi:hypothetical protein